MNKTTAINQDCERFSPDLNFGLNNEQVENRVSNGLTNKVKQKYSKSYLNIFVNNVCTFFNLLGLIVFIALLSIYGVELSGGDKVQLSDFFFVFFYIANISIGIIQEIRAKKCVDKLSLVANKGVKVLRNGLEIEIQTTDIVLDDLLKLGIGNQIPTDCIILQGDIEVNESLLTGESVPVKKKCGDPLLAGSFITSGVCLANAE